MGALISQVLIGVSGKNKYLNIHEILSRLGISNGNDLEHHFHIYVKPPTAVSIDTSRYIEAATLAGSLSDSYLPDTTPQVIVQELLEDAQTLIQTGEELMLTMDVPYVPDQQVPIVLAQASTASVPSTPDHILRVCQEIESSGDARSADRSVDPAGWLAVYLAKSDRRDIYGDRAAMASMKTTMLEGTKHGNLFAVVDNLGRTSYY